MAKPLIKLVGEGMRYCCWKKHWRIQPSVFFLGGGEAMINANRRPLRILTNVQLPGLQPMIFKLDSFHAPRIDADHNLGQLRVEQGTHAAGGHCRPVAMSTTRDGAANGDTGVEEHNIKRSIGFVMLFLNSSQL